MVHPMCVTSLARPTPGLQAAVSDVFISYAREDADWAELLAGRFEERGWSVFWDRTLLAGDQFRSVIRSELANARAIIVLWSQDSVQSSWVLDEARVGNERGVLVPALIDDSNIPLGFGQIQSPRLTQPDGQEFSDGVSSFLESVEKLISRDGSDVHVRGPLITEEQTPVSVPFLAAGGMALFIAAGFWLTPARPGYLWLPSDTSYLEAALWTWLGLAIMALGVFIGPRLAHNTEPLRAAVRALGGAAVAGAVVVLALLAIPGAGKFQALGFLVVVWVGTTLSLPFRNRRQRRNRFAILVGVVLGVVFLIPIVDSADFAAWPFAAVIPFLVVVSDWATSFKPNRLGNSPRDSGVTRT